MNKFDYFECECSSPDHILRVMYDEECNILYTEVQLRSGGLFSRIWKAIKYIFKVDVKDGYWDCVLIRPEDAPRFIELLEKLKGEK